MKKVAYIVSLYLFLFSYSISSYATHIYGGELLYTNVSGLTYLVTLTLYGDCSANPNTFESLADGTPVIFISDGTTTSSLILALDSSKEVSPVCPSQIANTSCHVNGTLPGVKRFVYSSIVSLPSTSANWTFTYLGYLTGAISAGRSAQITNVLNAGVSTMNITAFLNNLNGPNSSPQYSTIPTPYYCINTQVQYNQGALDPNGDSLVYALVPARDSSKPVTYAAPYTATAPLHTDTGTFSFDPLSGQISFEPDIIQRSLVVSQVSEYRNGVLVGTSEREMTFIVQGSCSIEPPTSNIITNSISGVSADSNRILYVCERTPNVSFNIAGHGQNNDSITVSYSNPLPTATISVQGNNTPSPIISFNWNTANVAPGVYNFYTTLLDNGCPESSTQSFAYTIYVIRPNTITAKQTGATACVHKATVEYDVSNGLLPRQIAIYKNNKLIDSLTDSTNVIIDSLNAGSYIITVSSPPFLDSCPTTIGFTVVDSGALPAPRDYYFTECIYGKEAPVNFIPFYNSNVVWHDLNGTVLPWAPTASTTTTGLQQWYVIQTFNVCESYADTVNVSIVPLPDIVIQNANTPTCLGNKIYFTATGGVEYEWSSSANKLFTDDGGIYANILEPGVYTVVGTDTNKCKDTTSFTFNAIEQCCLFSYPNSFTPNHDNINDKYQVVIYGNTDAYELEIYNRYGQRVFHSFDPSDGWDGTFHDQPCDIGTYFYLLRAHCLTGHSETHRGDITLIR